MTKDFCTTTFVDVNKSSTQVEDFVVSNTLHKEIWKVPVVPISLKQDAKIEWLTVSSGESLRIPLFPYVTTSTNPEVVVASVGMITMYTATAAGKLGQIPIEAHMSVGMPLEQIDHYEFSNGTSRTCFKMWIGMAFRLK